MRIVNGQKFFSADNFNMLTDCERELVDQVIRRFHFEPIGDAFDPTGVSEHGNCAFNEADLERFRQAFNDPSEAVWVGGGEATLGSTKPPILSYIESLESVAERCTAIILLDSEDDSLFSINAVVQADSTLQTTLAALEAFAARLGFDVSHILVDVKGDSLSVTSLLGQ